MSPSFAFKVDPRYENRRLTYAYELVTSAHAVIEQDMEAHAHAVDKARLLMGRSVTYRPGLADAATRPNWLMIAFGTVVLLASGALAWRTYRLDRSIANSRIGEGRPASFGGWLILLGFNVFLTPIMILVQASRVWQVLLSPLQWLALTTPRLASYRPQLAGLLVFEGAVLLAMCAYSCTVVATWVAKRRSFPWHYTILVSALACIGIFDVVAAPSTATDSDPASGGGKRHRGHPRRRLRVHLDLVPAPLQARRRDIRDLRATSRSRRHR